MTKIAIQAHPGARRNEVMRHIDGVWHIKIAAPAIEGKANLELVEYLSKILGVPKSRISLLKGATGKHKLIDIDGMTADEIFNAIEELLR